MAVSVLVGLGICEGALRLFWHNPYRNESPDRFVRLRLSHSNTDYVLDRSLVDPDDASVRFRTNERSYVLPASRFGPDDVTIAFLGGSTTECLVVKEELRFPALVSELLEEKGVKVNVLNAGRSGNTLHDSINNLFNHVLLDHPDIVVVMHAVNDIGVVRKDPTYSSRMGEYVTLGSQGKWAIQQLSGPSYLVALARRAMTKGEFRTSDEARSEWRNDPAQADAFPIAPYRSRLRLFVHMCRSFDIEPVLMTQPLSGTTNELTPDWADLGAQDRFNEVIRTVGKENDVATIDLVDHLKRNVPDWDKPKQVFYDGMHVTDRGSRIYAEHIAERLLPIVQKHVAAKRTGENAP